jgi:hypothetical protein
MKQEKKHGGKRRGAGRKAVKNPRMEVATFRVTAEEMCSGRTTAKTSGHRHFSVWVGDLVRAAIRRTS